MSLDLMELLPGDWRERLDPLLDPIATAALGAFVAGGTPRRPSTRRGTTCSARSGTARSTAPAC